MFIKHLFHQIYIIYLNTESSKYYTRQQMAVAAALPGRPAASRGVKLPLLPNTRSVF